MKLRLIGFQHSGAGTAVSVPSGLKSSIEYFTSSSAARPVGISQSVANVVAAVMAALQAMPIMGVSR